MFLNFTRMLLYYHLSFIYVFLIWLQNTCTYTYVLQFECQKPGPKMTSFATSHERIKCCPWQPCHFFFGICSNSSIAESATCYEETKCPESASIATRGLTGELKSESHGPNPKYWGGKTPTVSKTWDPWKIRVFVEANRIKHSISVGGA